MRNEISLTALFELNKEGMFIVHVEEHPTITAYGNTFEQAKLNLFALLKQEKKWHSQQVKLSIRFRYRYPTPKAIL